jgi:hypothetical protein
MYTELYLEDVRGMNHLEDICVDVNAIKIDHKRRRVLMCRLDSSYSGESPME